MDNIKITQYLQSNSRNKIVFINEGLPDIPCVDVGYLLAKALEKKTDGRHLSLIAEEKLDDIINNAIKKLSPFGNVLCMKNPGILFEKELKLNFQSFLDKYSKGIALFVKWDGEIEDNTLYFLSKQNGIKIDIHDLSHISL